MSMRFIRGGIGGLASTIAAAVLVLAPGSTSAAADTGSPSAPTDLHVQSVSFTSVTLGWNPAADDSGWVMYEAEANALPRSLQRFASTEPRTTITGLIPGLPYTASVVAVDGSRNSSAPASVQFTTPVDATPPTVPGNLRATPTVAPVDVIAWDASTDSSRIRYVIRSSGSFLTATYGTSVTAWDLLYLDCVVLPGSTHTLTVEAQDDFTNVSARSGAVTVTFPNR
ncbi:MAG TPA: fibronectin type III domain-containing protein [Actinophytocola sp.]|uniref:fibronectin type III domain-containing protein n=1 Tax=Actinophytocola sp. TaxID=1872138 RepID=UPI002DDDA2B7|nr:fibronectin type III domain-containing protein [Actinophytocola sp.]HEV2783511.1 fibronectin type III domain-containing protein [Actinophytocola sp.]